MRVIGLAVVLAVTLALAPLDVEAQQAEKVYRIGALWPGTESPRSRPSPGFDVFQQSLGDAGYVEGTNLSFSHRWGNRDALRDLATELVALRPDVLFASSGYTIQALAEATTAIPIVMISVVDPVDTGLIKSLARPGGNITGVSGRVDELNEKLLQVFKESVPRASRVAVMGHPLTVGLYRKGMEVAANSLRVRLQFLELTGLKELAPAFETAAQARAEGVVLLPWVLFALNESRIAELALQRHLPTIFWRSRFAEVGGLLAYGPDVVHIHRRAAALVVRIFHGARPAELPVEQADRFRLVINLKTAKALNLTIPQSVLLRADQVIE